MNDEGWEARMAAKAYSKEEADLIAQATARFGLFAKWWHPGKPGGYSIGGDPLDILPEILAARCLGIGYGDPGPRLPDEWCHECWGDRYVWLGNTWGLQHRCGTSTGCSHGCHENEVWLAAS